MKNFSEYEIPQEDLAKLARMVGKDEMTTQNEMPQEVVEQYILDRRRADAIGLRLSESELWNIVCRSASTDMNNRPQDAPKSIVDLFNAGVVKRGDDVVCCWRNWTAFEVPARLIGIDQGRPVVQFSDDQYGDVSEERRLNPACVKAAPKKRAARQKQDSKQAELPVEEATAKS